MTKRHSAIIAILIIVAVSISLLSGCNGCTGSAGDETSPVTESVSATLMPGYVDDNTTFPTEKATRPEDPTRVFIPDGPVKDGNYNSGSSSQGGYDNNDAPEASQVATSAGNQNTPSDKPSQNKPSATQAATQKPQEQTTDGSTQPASSAEVTAAQTTPADTQSTQEAETTEAVQATTAEQTASAETTAAETETLPDATEEVSEATEATEATASTSADATEPQTTVTTEDENKYPVPGVPDSDVVGPKPPIDMDDFLNPDNTVPATQSTTANVVSTSASTSTASSSTAVQGTTSEVVNTQVPVQTDAPHITEATEITASVAVSVATEPATEATNPTDASGRLEFSYYGSFTGEFVEDGSDEYVQNVAIIYVTNISERYLEYAVITFDIDGQVAAFTATGLAPGESLWVLEQNRLQVQKGAVFTYVDDMSSFTDYVALSDTGIDVILGDGQLRVKNNTGKDLTDVYVYYKQVHTDGNFLGGITYRVPIGELKAGEEADSVAMHSRVGSSRVVSVTYREEGN